MAKYVQYTEEQLHSANTVDLETILVRHGERLIRSGSQLHKNYGREGAEIIVDNCQDIIFGGFAPNSQTAEVLSKALGCRTVMSGSVNRGRSDPSQSLQMMERPLLTPDELKALPKGHFIVMKTGTHPMKTRLRLYSDWGITFCRPYSVSEKAQREVVYANRRELEMNIMKKSLTMSSKRVSDSSSVELGEETRTPNGKMLRYE